MRLVAEEDSMVRVRKETTKRTFTMADERLFIGMYRDTIYKNKLRVVPQEYMANARDAHREIGKDNVPIEVTLPTVEDPILIIRDFGPGIDEERSAIFSQYGASTKRGSDDQNGGFGIGCKCAWSYTESFNVDTVFEQDGVKVHRIYSVYVTHKLDPGNIRVVSEEIVSRNTPTGTKVCIPIMSNDIGRVVESVATVGAFWDVQPIITNDPDFTFSVPEVEQEGDGWKLLRSVDLFGIRSKSIAVVDGICYDIDLDILSAGRSQYEEKDEEGDVEEVHYGITDQQKRVLRSCRLAFLFSVNEVEVAPDRENLSYTVRTIKAMRDRIDLTVNFLIKSTQDLIAGCSNYREALIAGGAIAYKLGIAAEWHFPDTGEKADIGKAYEEINQCTFLVVQPPDYNVDRIKKCWDLIQSPDTAIVAYKTLGGAQMAASVVSNMPDSYLDFMKAARILFVVKGDNRRTCKHLVTHKRIGGMRSSGYARDERPILTGVFDASNVAVTDFDVIPNNAFYVHRYRNDCFVNMNTQKRYIPVKHIQRLFPGRKIFSVSKRGERILTKQGLSVRYVDADYSRTVLSTFQKMKIGVSLEGCMSYEEILVEHKDAILKWAQKCSKPIVDIGLRLYYQWQQIEETHDKLHEFNRWIIKEAKSLGAPFRVIDHEKTQCLRKILKKHIPFLQISVRDDKILRNIILSYQEHPNVP